MTRRILGLAVLLAAFVACDGITDPGAAGDLSIQFATVSTSTAASMAPSASQAGSLTVTGNNGTLTIEEIYVIVDKFKLEGADDACESVEDDDEDDTELDDCEEFESERPALVSIPLDGSEVNVLDASVPTGTYSALEWEVEDADFDEDDEDEAELAALRSEIDSIFGAGVWPAEASMVVIGSFQDTSATDPTPFTTFFEAEIEVESEIAPALEITEDGASRELTINFDPQSWFLLDSGDVLDLAALSDSVVEFELEFEDGIASIEHEEEDDD